MCVWRATAPGNHKSSRGMGEVRGAIPSIPALSVAGQVWQVWQGLRDAAENLCVIPSTTASVVRPVTILGSFKKEMMPTLKLWSEYCVIT